MILLTLLAADRKEPPHHVCRPALPHVRVQTFAHVTWPSASFREEGEIPPFIKQGSSQSIHEFVLAEDGHGQGIEGNPLNSGTHTFRSGGLEYAALSDGS